MAVETVTSRGIGQIIADALADAGYAVERGSRAVAEVTDQTTVRDRIVGLNCGRWDYIFSYIKIFRKHADKVLPERGQVTMTQPFLKAYSELLIQTCHRRGAHAMGGMAAQIPINHDAAANEQAMARVRADKLREVTAGHDGTWVAHPALIPVAQAIFDAHMPGPNQHAVLRRDVRVGRDELIAAPTGTTRVNWRLAIDAAYVGNLQPNGTAVNVSGTTVNSVGSGMAAEYLPGLGKELLPIPQTTLDTDPALKQNFGY